MLVCKRSPDAAARDAVPAPEAPERRPGEGGSAFTARQGGPVFVPRRKPSALAEALLAEDGERVTAYDETWFAGRPAT